MIRRTRPILFVLGPSGSGKSTLGVALAARGFLHVELDAPTLTATAEGLKPGLEILAGSARIGPLVVALESRREGPSPVGIVVTFDSRMTLSPRQHAAVVRAGIDLVVLYGTGAACLDGAVERERSRGNVMPPARWIEHNARSYAELSLPHLAPHRVDAFQRERFVGADLLTRRAAASLAERNPQWLALAFASRTPAAEALPDAEVPVAPERRTSQR